MRAALICGALRHSFFFESASSRMPEKSTATPAEPISERRSPSSTVERNHAVSGSARPSV